MRRPRPWIGVVMGVVVVGVIVGAYVVLARHGTTSARTFWRTDGPVSIQGQRSCAAAELPMIEQFRTERWAVCMPSGSVRRCFYEPASGRRWTDVSMGAVECRHAYTVLHDNGLIG